MLTVICFLVGCSLIVIFMWIQFVPMPVDFSFGGLFTLNFDEAQNKSYVIKEIIPSKFPNPNSMFYKYSDFFDKHTNSTRHKTITINTLIEIILDKSRILSPFCIDDNLNIIMIETPAKICLTNDSH
eukprot:32259_1